MGIFIIVQDPTWFGSNFFLLQPNLRMKLDSDKLRQSFHVSNYVWNLQREMLKPNSQDCAVIPRVRVSANRLDLSSNLCTFEKWKNILINRQRPIQRHIHTHTHGHTVSKFKNLIWMFQCLSFSATVGICIYFHLLQEEAFLMKIKQDSGFWLYQNDIRSHFIARFLFAHLFLFFVSL